MTGIFAIQYWLILFLMVGLGCTRRYISRGAWAVVTAAIARVFVRSVIFFVEGEGDHSFSSAVGNDYFILAVNLIVMGVLFSEMVTGTKCWRLYRLEKRREKRRRMEYLKQTLAIEDGDDDGFKREGDLT
jgi:hypothetical protein